MSLHPSRYPKMRDGKRFWVFDNEVVASGCLVIAKCNNAEDAEMIAAALEFQARDGETFPLEVKE